MSTRRARIRSELVDRTERLQGRVLMLENQINGKAEEAKANPIESQLALLRTAFSGA